MKHPLWMLNSGLLFLLAAVFGYLFFSRTRLPRKASMKPAEQVTPIAQRVSEVNIEKIYANDLFGTYIKDRPQLEIVEKILAFPEPPPPRPEEIPKIPELQFLDPLKIVLKGIIVTVNNDAKNRAIIAEEETGKEAIFKVGDAIEDAKLVRIFHNKIILIRSNGQQEILYLREQDTKLDPAYTEIIGWGDIVEQIDNTTYAIKVKDLLKRITSVVQFIDALDMSPAYKQGNIVGMHIGSLSENSLGHALGLQQGDIVIEVNDIPATSNADRLAIYKSIIAPQNNKSTIKVMIVRANNIILFSYILNFESKEDKLKKETRKAKKSVQDKAELLKQKYQFAPTAREIKMKERKNMRKNAQQPETSVTE